MSSPALQETLRAVRRARGLTRTQISQRLGVDAAYWRMYEEGRRQPGMAFLVRAIRALDLSDAEVLGIVHAGVADSERKGKR